MAEATVPTEAAGPAARAEQEDATDLRRAITLPRMFLFILGDVLGAGVYVLIGTVAGEVGGAVWAPFLLALTFALFTAFSYAELVTKYPRAGGASVFVQRAFGNDLLSFVVGFAMLSAAIAAGASLASAFAGDYLGQFVDVDPRIAAVVFLVLVAALNLRGIDESMKVNVVLTVIEVGGLLLAIVLGFATVATGGGDPSQLTSFATDRPMALAILSGSVIAFYAFLGFETSANVAEECIEPRRIYPIALLSAIAVAGVVYLLLGAAIGMVVPLDELADSSAPLLGLIERSPVAFPVWLFSIIALLAVSNGALLFTIAASRLLYGMAREGLVPAALGRLNTRKTPPVAAGVTLVLTAGLVLTGDLETLAETTVLLLVIVFAGINAAVLALRRQPVDAPHFRTPVVMPILGLVSVVAVMTQQTAATWGRAGILLVVGLVLYGLTRLATRREPSA
jgi:amino acid transporter